MPLLWELLKVLRWGFEGELHQHHQQKKNRTLAGIFQPQLALLLFPNTWHWNISSPPLISSHQGLGLSKLIQQCLMVDGPRCSYAQSFRTGDLLTGYAHESEQVINSALTQSLIAACACWRVWQGRERADILSYSGHPLLPGHVRHCRL